MGLAIRRNENDLPGGHGAGFAAVLFICLAFAYGCTAPLGPKSGESGAVTVRFGLTGAEASSKTLLPKPADSLDKYRLTLTKSGGTPVVVRTVAKTTTSETVSQLVPGTWTVVAEALNATDVVIARSPEYGITVNLDATTSVTADLLPLTSGTGKLSLVLSFPSGTFSGVTVRYGSLAGTAYPTAFTTVNATLETTDTSKTIEINNIPGGRHLVLAELTRDGASPAVFSEAVRIDPNLTTTGSFTFTPTEFTSPPSAPTDLSVTWNGTAMVLTWNVTSSLADRYVVERSIDGGAFAFLANAEGSGTQMYTDTTRPMGTTYVYGVRARNAWGDSAAVVSNPQTARHLLSYDGNGATGGSVPVGAYLEPGASFVIPDNPGSLVKTGFTFAGWLQGVGEVYPVGSSQNIGDRDMTIFAAWVGP